jgi:hypothetical protein
VDVQYAPAGLTQIMVCDCLKLVVPIHDIVLSAVNRVQAHIAIGVVLPPPDRGKDVSSTIDDVSNTVLGCVPRSEKGARSYEDSRMEPGGWLPQVVGNVHCFYSYRAC